MFEFWAYCTLMAGAYFVGYWRGEKQSEKRFMGLHVGNTGAKCSACGVLVEGGGLEMESHSRFYCKSQKRMTG